MALIVNEKKITHATKRYVKDDSGHWFVIHKEDMELFNDLLDKAIMEDYMGENFEEFEKRFNMGMTGGDMYLLEEHIED